MDKEYKKKIIEEENLDEKIVETLGGWMYAFWNLREYIYFNVGKMPLDIKMMNYKELVKSLERYLKNNPEQEYLFHKMVKGYYEETLKSIESLQDPIISKNYKAITPKNYDDIINYKPIVQGENLDE